MEIETHKEVTHTLTMTHTELCQLRGYLAGYDREIVQRLPSHDSSITGDFYAMQASIDEACRKGNW